MCLIAARDARGELYFLFSELASTDALGELPVLGAAQVPHSAFGGVAG